MDLLKHGFQINASLIHIQTLTEQDLGAPITGFCMWQNESDI